MTNTKLFIKWLLQHKKKRFVSNHSGGQTLTIIPQPTEDIPNVGFHLDGVHAHYKSEVRELLNNTSPDRYVGRYGKEDRSLLRWASRSPELTP